MGLSIENGAKSALQKRSQQTRDKILKAMDELLRDGDFEMVTIAKLAASAGVSAASIYQRFANKDALISILIELYVEKVRGWNDAAGKGAEFDEAHNFRDMLMSIGVSAWRQFEALHYVMRPAYLYSRMRPELLGGHWQAQEKLALQGFEAMLRQWPDDIGGKSIESSAQMIAYFYNMMFLGKLLHTEPNSEWNLQLSEAEFAAQLADFVIGYLATDGAQNGAI